MSDQAHKLEHDHTESLRYLTDALSGLIDEAQRGALEGAKMHESFAELHDEMCREVEHFAMEESELFPKFKAALPALGEQIAQVERSHRTLDALVARLATLIHRGPEAFQGSLAEVTELARNFIHEYARHAAEERALFAAVDRSLDDAQKKALQEAVETR